MIEISREYLDSLNLMQGDRLSFTDLETGSIVSGAYRLHTDEALVLEDLDLAEKLKKRNSIVCDYLQISGFNVDQRIF